MDKIITFHWRIEAEDNNNNNNNNLVGSKLKKGGKGKEKMC